MKSRLPTLERRIKEEVARQVKQERSMLYDEVSADVVRQTVAVSALCLEKGFEFTADDIKRFIDDVFSILDIKPLGHEITAPGIITYIKSKYGIDLDTFQVLTRVSKKSPTSIGGVECHKRVRKSECRNTESGSAGASVPESR